MSARTTSVESPAQAVIRLSASGLRDGCKFVALHEYRATDGTPLYWRIRAKNPQTGKKWIRPMHWNGSEYVMGEPEAPPEGKPLYGLDRLTAPDAPVWIVEGESCADSLNKLGLIAVTSGGSSSADAADWTPLQGRSVIIWPDHDTAGLAYAEAVAIDLRALGCDVRLVAQEVVEALPERGDCVDWIAANANASADELRALPTVEASGGSQEPETGPNGTAHDPCTHLANAYRIVEHYGDRLLYVEGIGWHTWSPPWRDDDLGARRIAQGLGQIIAKEAAEMAQGVADAKDKDERDRREKAMNARFKWAGSSESMPVIEHSLRMAAPLLSCKASELDAKPSLLGLPSGVLDLATGEHREHQQADLLTKVAGCDFDAEATAPTWERFIDEAMGGDAELSDYLQRLVGYILSGERGEHLLPILWGTGANGKSTFLGAIEHALGDYASGAAPGLLIQRYGTEHPTGLADLQGKRLVVVSETGEAGRLNEEQAKMLTGGDAITARRMRQDYFTFQPTHQLLLQTNHRPRVTGTDEGVWRRLRLIPFAVTIPKDRRDPRLPEKLRRELPGILAWAWHGWQRYQADGFNEPAAVRAATAEYRDASDAVGGFLAECCVIDDVLTAQAGDLYSAYSEWCTEGGERPRSQREFGMRLSERGFDQTRTGRARRWRGLGLPNGDASDGSDGDSRMNAIESRSCRGYTESPVTSVTSVTNKAEAYRSASRGDA